MARKDAHRPSAIIPEDYDFVAAFSKGDCLVGATENAQQRSILRDHMERTGGKYSDHEHGGSCHVCGASMIYAAVFFHLPSRTYIRTGFDCAEKLGASDSEVNLFRRVRTEAQALEQAKAGKLKAQGLLREKGMLEAVREIFEPESLMVANTALCLKLDEIIESERSSFYRSLANQAQDKIYTACDIVRKLVKYGSLSEGQWKFLASLLEQQPWNTVEQRIAELEAKREAERAAGTAAPEGRTVVTGEIVSTKMQDGNFGTQFKMLVKADDGYKVWSVIPRQLWAQDGVTIENLKGKRVEFVATLKRSDDDETFAFGSRPAKGKLLEDK